MKSQLVRFAIVVLLSSTFSCKKTVANHGLVGKWKLIEQLEGYAGGNAQWTAVSSAYSQVLSFTADGNYQRTETNNGNPMTCTGSYSLQRDVELEINTTCNPVTERAIVSERTAQTLVLDRTVGRDGVTRYRYSASK